MGKIHKDSQDTKKKGRLTERKMTTALFTLRCIQLGLRLDDLDRMEIGEIYDLFTENANDDYNYAEIATQEDFDAF